MEQSNLDDIILVMSYLFLQKKEVCIVFELLKILKLQGHLVPSFLHFPVEWENLYDKDVKVVECIDFPWKDEIITTE